MTFQELLGFFRLMNTGVIQYYRPHALSVTPVMELSEPVFLV